MTDFLLYILFQLIKKSVCYLTFTETSTSLRSNEASNYARRDTLIAINTPFMLNLSFLVGTNERVTFLQNTLDCVISIIVTFFSLLFSLSNFAIANGQRFFLLQSLSSTPNPGKIFRNNVSIHNAHHYARAQVLKRKHKSPHPSMWVAAAAMLLNVINI